MKKVDAAHSLIGLENLQNYSFRAHAGLQNKI